MSHEEANAMYNGSKFHEFMPTQSKTRFSLDCADTNRSSIL